jgi:hypothetical protein
LRYERTTTTTNRLLDEAARKDRLLDAIADEIASRKLVLEDLQLIHPTLSRHTLRMLRARERTAGSLALLTKLLDGLRPELASAA